MVGVVYCMETKEWNPEPGGGSKASDDLVMSHTPAQILTGLQEEFEKGLEAVASARKNTVTLLGKKMLLKKEIHIPSKGQSKWEEIRRASIKNIPITSMTVPASQSPDRRSRAYKIHLKEEIVYFNVCGGYMLVITKKRSLKIYTVLPECKLRKKWESANTLFVFLLESSMLSDSAADTLSLLLILMLRKNIENLERVFESFLLFIRARGARRMFFWNNYVFVVSQLGDLSVFDESLREIPVKGNARCIIRSIRKEKLPKQERLNAKITAKKEVIIPLEFLTIKVSPSKIKIVYAKKSIYEEINLTQNQQVVYSDAMLFLRDQETVHAIILDSE